MIRICLVLALVTGWTVTGCTAARSPGQAGVDAGVSDALPRNTFVCWDETTEACLGNVHWRCERDPSTGGLRRISEDCATQGNVCVPNLWCRLCAPASRGCDASGDVTQCSEDGMSTTVVNDCRASAGQACYRGTCQTLCAIASEERSYVGCEFYAVDLDNAALGGGRDASAQQYALVISNPGFLTAEVTVEIDLGPFGGPTAADPVRQLRVLPGDLEVVPLARREVDGSSSFTTCDEDSDCRSASERCWCAAGTPPGPDATDCRCRSSPEGNGMNDGTHSALTAHAYRIRSTMPVIAYQFNPLENVSVFSNDASLLLPSTALGGQYMVVTWPQTIADSQDRNQDWDRSRTGEDLRTFLTIVGLSEGTQVEVELGPEVVKVEPVGQYTSPLYAGNVLRFNVGEFDVINLETQGFNADFTGTIVDATAPVAVFVGSEASDAPFVPDLTFRQCCADHVEDQLFPTDALGYSFWIGRAPPRTTALNAAFVTPDQVAEVNEPEYVRIVAVVDNTVVRIAGDDETEARSIRLDRGEGATEEIDRDIRIVSEGGPIAVLQVLASQDRVGIPRDYPGGDPSIIAVPPVEQWRADYVFLTPDKYAFDFITVVAPADAQILLDEEPIGQHGCEVEELSVPLVLEGDSAMRVYRCQFSFPEVTGFPNVTISPGRQNDGYHTLRSTRPVSVVVTGFDRYVSYGYVAGAQLRRISM